MTIRAFKLAALPLILLGLSTATHANPAKDTQSITQNLLPQVRLAGDELSPKSLMQRMAEENLPGLSVAVLKDGEIVWAQGFGIANKETGTKVTTETLFQAGSISKPLGALGALVLVQDGKVDLDTDVNQYLTSWKIESNEFTKTQPVTLRHLLTHTGGLTVHGFPGYQTGETIPSNQDVLNGEGNTGKVSVDTLPGSGWRYSGGGYTVMEQLVEDVGKMPFDQFLQTRVLAPMGMTNSNYYQPLPESLHMQASAAFDSKGEQIEGDWHHYPEQAAAGLWTTPSDIARYMLAMQQGRSGKTQTILNKASIDAMLTEHRGSWGLGPELRDLDSGLAFSHGGKNAGFTNTMIAYADSENGMVIMANGDSAGPVINELRIAIASHYGWDLAEPVELKPLAFSDDLNKEIKGDYAYQSQPDYIVSLSVKGDRVEVFDRPSDDYLYFVKTDEGEFSNVNSGSTIKLDYDSEGKVTGLTWAGSHKFNKVK